MTNGTEILRCPHYSNHDGNGCRSVRAQMNIKEWLFVVFTGFNVGYQRIYGYVGHASCIGGERSQVHRFALFKAPGYHKPMAASSHRKYFLPQARLEPQRWRASDLSKHAFLTTEPWM